MTSDVVPLLVVWGAKDRLEIDYQAARAIAELIESEAVAGRTADDAAVPA